MRRARRSERSVEKTRPCQRCSVMSSKSRERSRSTRKRRDAAALEPGGLARSGQADGEHHESASAFGSCLHRLGRRGGQRFRLGFDHHFAHGSGGAASVRRPVQRELQRLVCAGVRKASCFWRGSFLGSAERLRWRGLEQRTRRNRQAAGGLVGSAGSSWPIFPVDSEVFGPTLRTSSHVFAQPLAHIQDVTQSRHGANEQWCYVPDQARFCVKTM